MTKHDLTPSANSVEAEKPNSSHMLFSLLKHSSLPAPTGNSWEEFQAPLKLLLLQEVFPDCPTPQTWPISLPCSTSIPMHVRSSLEGSPGRSPCPQCAAAQYPELGELRKRMSEKSKTV